MGLSHKNIPEWLENNLLFRKLFLFRKVFLTKKKFNHYGQFAEDITVNRLFPKDKKGVFLDIGCFHPIKYSNTWALYKKGWRGINVDIDSIKIEAFNMVRSKDTNVACAVSNKTGEVGYYRRGFYSLLNTLDKEFADERGGYKEDKVNCDTLTNIIDDSEFKDATIDYLSIDTEGNDFKVLSSLDFERYAPSVIAFESHHDRFDQNENTDIYQFLKSKNFELVGWCGLTLIMAKKEFMENRRG